MSIDGWEERVDGEILAVDEAGALDVVSVVELDDEVLDGGISGVGGGDLERTCRDVEDIDVEFDGFGRLGT